MHEDFKNLHYILILKRPNISQIDVPHLEILHLGLSPFEESLKLEVGVHLVEDEDLAVHVLSGRVEEVVQEVADGDRGDVRAQDDELLLLVNLP